MPQCDLLLRRNVEGVSAKGSGAAAAGDQIPADIQIPAGIVIPECVDKTVFYVLHAMDSDIDLHLSYTTKGGETVDWSVVGWGEPIGWYAGTPGWRTWYSKERIDDRNNLGVKDDTEELAPNQEELPMPRRAIEELGELLVRHVRDVAIQSCDMQLLPHSNTPMAKRWRCAAIPFHGKVPPRVLIPDCVDEAIFAFLRAIDQGLLRLSFTAENGETVDLVKEGRGELATRYIESGGWRAKYSKERFFDNNREWTAEELAAIATVIP